MKWLQVLGLVAVVGCEGAPGPDGPGSEAVGDGCETVACYLGDEVFCGEPAVRLGTGFSEYAPLEGDAMPIVWAPGANGGVCGYHLELAFETENLCQVVGVDYEVHLLGIDGGAISQGSRTIQFVRAGEDDSVQHIWSINAVIPEAYYPADPVHADVCPGEQKLPCDESELLIQVRVEDLSGRVAAEEYLLEPVCCEG